MTDCPNPTKRPGPDLVHDDEAGASFRMLSSGRGTEKATPEKTDYCLSVSVSVSVSASASALAGVAAGASVPLDSPRFSEVADSVGMSGALDTAVF